MEALTYFLDDIEVQESPKEKTIYRRKMVSHKLQKIHDNNGKLNHIKHNCFLLAFDCDIRISVDYSKRKS